MRFRELFRRFDVDRDRNGRERQRVHAQHELRQLGARHLEPPFVLAGHRCRASCIVPSLGAFSYLYLCFLHMQKADACVKAGRGSNPLRTGCARDLRLFPCPRARKSAAVAVPTTSFDEALLTGSLALHVAHPDHENKGKKIQPPEVGVAHLNWRRRRHAVNVA